MHFSHSTEVFLGFLAALGGVFGSVTLATGSFGPESWLVIFEKGGFLLLTLLCIAFFVWLVLPKMMDWLRAYLERLENRNVIQLEGFMQELKEQRLSRERTEDAFREMLQSHKRETVGAISEQTGYVKELVKELKGRPCQVHYHRRAEDIAP